MILSKFTQHHFMPFHRNQVQALRERLQEPPLLITIVAGPRQVGKTTLVRQALEKCAHCFLAVDQPAETSLLTSQKLSGQKQPSCPRKTWLSCLLNY
jgi:hypothetical protein